MNLAPRRNCNESNSLSPNAFSSFFIQTKFLNYKHLTLSSSQSPREQSSAIDYKRSMQENQDQSTAESSLLQQQSASLYTDVPLNLPQFDLERELCRNQFVDNTPRICTEPKKAMMNYTQTEKRDSDIESDGEQEKVGGAEIEERELTNENIRRAMMSQAMIMQGSDDEDEDEARIEYRVNDSVYPPALEPIMQMGTETEKALQKQRGIINGNTDSELLPYIKAHKDFKSRHDDGEGFMNDEDEIEDSNAINVQKGQIIPFDYDANLPVNQQPGFDLCPGQFVDLSNFPGRFGTEDDALATYNAMGLQYRIQFKKFQRLKNENGFVTKFSLCCHRRCLNKWKVNQGIMIKRNDLLDCPVQVRFRWSHEKQAYFRCRRMFMHHTHHLEIKDRHFIYNAGVLNDIRLYVACGLQPNIVQQLVNKKYSVNTRYCDVYHMVKQTRKQQNKELSEAKSDVQQLIDTLVALKKRDPDFKFAYQLDEEEDCANPMPKIDRMFIQTPMMSKYYQQYSDVVFMDATYKTNKHDLALTIISSVSGEGRNIILGIAFLQRETADHYTWLLQTLLEFNGGREPGTIITDYDSSMCAGIEKVFNKTNHLLCQWHMMQNLKKHFVFLNKTKKLYQKQLYNHIIECIFTPDPRKFQELQDIIFQQCDQLDEQRMSYLRSLFQIKEKWAHAFQPHSFNAGLRTISRAESVNHMIKSRQKCKQTIIDLFKLILEVEKRVVERSFTDHKHERREAIHNPLLRELHKCYTHWSYEQMLFQYRESHVLTVKFVPQKDQAVPTAPIFTLDTITGDSAIFYVKDTIRNKGPKHQVVLRLTDEGEVTCNCEYFRGYNIYCEHIFAVFNRLQIKSAGKFKKLNRWTRNCQGDIHKEEEKEFRKVYDLGKADDPGTQAPSQGGYNPRYGYQIRGRSAFLAPSKWPRKQQDQEEAKGGDDDVVEIKPSQYKSTWDHYDFNRPKKQKLEENTLTMNCGGVGLSGPFSATPAQHYAQSKTSYKNIIIKTNILCIFFKQISSLNLTLEFWNRLRNQQTGLLGCNLQTLYYHSLSHSHYSTLQPYFSTKHQASSLPNYRLMQGSSHDQWQTTQSSKTKPQRIVSQF